MAFVWHDFGILEQVTDDQSYVYITNTDGKTLKMSKRTYKESAISAKEKAQNFINSHIEVRTSQNTADWSTEAWFSDLRAI